MPKEQVVMSKSLDNPEDVQNTQDSLKTGDRTTIKVPDEKTPWRIVSVNYTDSYVHWTKPDGGVVAPAVCGGGPEGGGRAIDSCLLCKYVKDMYDLRDQFAGENDSIRASKAEKVAKDNQAQYACHVGVIKGGTSTEKKKVKVKGQIVNRRVIMADFDYDLSDANCTVEVGKLSLSKAQFAALLDLISDEKCPMIQSGADLVNRILWTTRKEVTSGGFTYKAVIWTPDAHTSDMPDIDYDEETVDTSKDFLIDFDVIEKAYNRLTGDSDDMADDEEVDIADDFDDDVTIPTDDFLDDVGDDDGSDEDVVDDDFEDDLPEGFDEAESVSTEYEEDEVEEKPVQRKRKTTSKPSVTPKTKVQSKAKVTRPRATELLTSKKTKTSARAAVSKSVAKRKEKQGATTSKAKPRSGKARI